MSRQSDWICGQYHLNLRIKGPAQRIELFMAAMAWIEGDWPWKPRGMKKESKLYYLTRGARPIVRVCGTCNGVIISSPRISPADIKACGMQFGLKVKVDRMAESEHCFDSKNHLIIHDISSDEARELYKHKAKRMRIENKYVLVGTETVEEHETVLKALNGGVLPEPGLPIHTHLTLGRVIEMPPVTTETVH